LWNATRTRLGDFAEAVTFFNIEPCLPTTDEPSWMTLIRYRTQNILRGIAIAFASIVLTMPLGARTAAAEPAPPLPSTDIPARPLTDAELEKINRTIADKGSEIRLNRETTTQLGVTRGDELLLSRGIAVKDEVGDVHEFEPLSDGKGYLILKLSPQLNTIYWVSKAFVLTAARSRVPGQPSQEMPLAEAKAGVAKELAYWAAFARE
jgi:hypothetical protein